MDILSCRAFVENAKRANTNSTLGSNRQGVDINALDDDRHSVLYYAVGRGLKDEAFDLMDLGADIDLRDNRGISLLHLSVILRHNDIVSELLKRGAKIDTLSLLGVSPLAAAAHGSDMRIAFELVAYAATNVDETKATSTLTVSRHTKLAKMSAMSMHQGAAQGGHTQRLKVLFNDFPSSARSDQPQALLKLALKHKRDDCAAFLQSHIASQAVNELLDKKPRPKSSPIQ